MDTRNVQGKSPPEKDEIEVVILWQCCRRTAEWTIIAHRLPTAFFTSLPPPPLFQRAEPAPFDALAAPDAFAVVYFERVHFTRRGACAAVRALCSINLYSEYGDFIKKRIYRAERADKSAERAVREHGPYDERSGKRRLPREKPSDCTAQVFVQEYERNAGSDSSRGAYELAEVRRTDSVEEIIRKRQRNAQYGEKYIF